MSGAPPDGTVGKPADPILKFLGGCALVVGALLAVCVLVAVFVGWRLVRDDTPPRPEEAFLTADDTRYWCFDLKPDDPGLVAAANRVQARSEATRDEMLKSTPFGGIPFPRRRAELDKILPMRVEIAEAPSRVEGDRSAWTGRVTLSKAVFRIRAGLKLVRWLAARDATKATRRSVDGIEITTFHDKLAGDIAFAMVGDRVLGANDTGRLASILANEAHPSLEGVRTFPAPEQRHAEVRRDGELGWGFQDLFEIPAATGKTSVGEATASFKIDGGGALDVRIVVKGLDGLDADRARAVTARFLPGIEPASLVLSNDTPKRRGDGAWEIQATVADVSEQLLSPLMKMMEAAARQRGRELSEPRSSPRTPPATPTPPSPPPTSGPRNGTPSESRHAETPNSAR